MRRLMMAERKGKTMKRWTYKDSHGEWRFVHRAGELTLCQQTGTDHVTEKDWRIARGSQYRRSAVTVAEFDALFDAATDAPA